MRNLIAGVVFLLSAGCIPGNSPIRIIGAFDLDAKCMIGMTERLRGFLDISGPGTYVTDFRIESEILSQMSVNGQMQPLTTPGAHNFVAETFSVTYKSTDPVIAFDAENIAVFGVIKPGETADVFGDIIGPKAAQKLRDNVTDANADPQTTLTVGLTVKGHLQSGEA